MKESIQSIEDYEAIAYSAAEDFNRKDYETALKKFLDMENANPKNKKLHEILFYIYLRLDRIEDAEKERIIYMNMIKEENPLIKPSKTFEDLVEGAGELNTVKKEFDRIMKDENSDIFEALEVFNCLNVLYLANEEYDKAEKAADVFQEKYLPVFSSHILFNKNGAV